jgi:hypothetical protein
MKKKNLIYAVIAGVLILFSLFIVLYENRIFKKPAIAADMFAVKDTSAVTKIFMADMSGNTVLLKKTPQGWMINDSIFAMQEKVKDLLGIMKNLMIRELVSKKAHSNINAMLAVGAIKVEIYEFKPKFSLFGIKFQEKERLSKVYYMGSATPDNLGNYAAMEGLAEPCILYKPGFRGFVTPQFSPLEYEWYSHKIFDTKLTRIQKLQIIDYENPTESFSVEKTGPRFFTLLNESNHPIMNYDTTKLIDMLSEFRNKNYESIALHISQGRKDSILQENHFRQIVLTDVEGTTTTLDMYRLLDVELIENGETNSIVNVKNALNEDRFYAVLNGNMKTLYKMQYQHFERQIQPLSYFLK